MQIQDLLLPEFQQEIELTEKFLRRLPEDKLGWKPHNKSMSILELSNHLAEIPSWITIAMNEDELKMDEYKPSELKTVEELVSKLNMDAAETEKSLKKEDEEYQKNWKMTMGGKTVMEMPRLQILRKVFLNQFPHHRAQLGVYYRLLDIPVPATYGPSADEY